MTEPLSTLQPSSSQHDVQYLILVLEKNRIWIMNESILALKYVLEVFMSFDSLLFLVGRKIFLILLCSNALLPGFYRIAIFNQLLWFDPYLAPIVTQKSLHSLAHPLCIDQSKNWSGSRPDSILSAPVRYSTRWTCKKRWWTNLTCLIWTRLLWKSKMNPNH